MVAHSCNPSTGLYNVCHVSQGYLPSDTLSQNEGTDRVHEIPGVPKGADWTKNKSWFQPQLYKCSSLLPSFLVLIFLMEG